MNAALNDPYVVLLVLFCAAVITIGSIVTALHRLPRAAFAQLQTELKELSGRVRELEAAEQRRFIRGLNSHREGVEGAEAKYATMGVADLRRKAPCPLKAAGQFGAALLLRSANQSRSRQRCESEIYLRCEQFE